MARRKSKSRKPARRRTRKAAARKQSKTGTARHLTAHIGVRSTGSGAGAKAFEACVIVGKGQEVCDKGKNPRTAIAKALRATAAKTSKRAGAFAGL